MTEREVRASALVARNGDGQWTVVGSDGVASHFDDSLSAELHAMELVRDLGGGELLIRDKKNRPPRRLVIRGTIGGEP